VDHLSPSGLDGLVRLHDAHDIVLARHHEYRARIRSDAAAPVEGPSLKSTAKAARFENPLYTVAEAARIVALPPSTFAAWAKGYVRRGDGRADVTGTPVITCLPTTRA